MKSIFKRLLVNVKSTESPVSYKLTTSLSDNEVYPDFCLKASNDLLLFSNFRRNEVYQQILEHLSKELGEFISRRDYQK